MHFSFLKNSGDCFHVNSCIFLNTFVKMSDGSVFARITHLGSFKRTTMKLMLSDQVRSAISGHSEFSEKQKDDYVVLNYQVNPISSFTS